MSAVCEEMVSESNEHVIIPPTGGQLVPRQVPGLTLTQLYHSPTPNQNRLRTYEPAQTILCVNSLIPEKYHEQQLCWKNLANSQSMMSYVIFIYQCANFFF